MAVAALASCGSPYYTADPIEAWVVDAETGKAIEGAVVVAHWQLRGFSIDSGTRRNQLEVVETVTDRNGRFFIRGFTKINFTLEQLGDEDPRIVVFKRGYSPSGGHNHYSATSAPGSHRSSRLNGMQLKMKSLGLDYQAYAHELEVVSSTLMDLSVSGDLERVPKLIHSMLCEKRRMKALLPQVLLDIPGETNVSARCEDE